MLNSLRLNPLPSFIVPEVATPVPIVIHEREIRSVRHRQHIDVESRSVNNVTIELVVPPEEHLPSIGTEFRYSTRNRRNTR